jgi:hypothetical protein
MDRYVMIGAGGTGSHFIAPALAYLHAYQTNINEAWEFLVIDGDNYEYKNLERQLFDPDFVGQNKADALVSMYPRYPLISVPKFIGKDDLGELISEHSTVFIGVDNYSLRALIVEHVQSLNNVTIINAGNEKSDGSVQLWVRRDGKNMTPPLTFCHPEIQYIANDDRSAMTCAQAAQIPGGEQLIIANFTAAQGMLHALWRVHTGAWEKGWTESIFDLEESTFEYINFRDRRGWDTHTPPKVVMPILTEGLVA